MYAFGRTALLASTALALTATVALAQEITTEIRGTVVDPSGAPIAGATVAVVDTRTGQTRTTTTNAVGGFNARGLAVGGPFTVTVRAEGYRGQTIDGIYTDLSSGATVVTVGLETLAAGETEVIVVTASALDTVQVAIGPSATFNAEDLADRPAINRDIRDIIRADPRIYIDESFVDAVQCAGANPRFNSLTVDGVRTNDGFGLNSNGYPTERQPFPYDAIQAVAVELSPLDVQYGGFSACNINAVTKGGTNEFHGGAFFDYASDSLTGDTLEGGKVHVGAFDEYRYGAHLGGPIIPDQLFFFGAFERLKGADTFDRGPVGSGSVVEVAGFNEQDYQDILDIARNVYHYDPGNTPTSMPNKDLKVLAKLDWLITPDQRATFTFNYNDGFHISQSDSSNQQFEFSNHLYERGAKLISYSGALFSDWTDNFSSEIRFGYVDLRNRQISLGGTDFGEMQVRSRSDGGFATVYLGADDSRHANHLNYSIYNLVAKAFYQYNNHHLTFGFENETTDIFNVFVQQTRGEYRFNSIADFEAGEPYYIEYSNAPSGNPYDAAAKWKYSVHTLYGQDEYEIPEWDLTLTGGIRFDWYMSKSVPQENPLFTADYGFSNADNLNGKGLVQPRLGFNWEASDRLTVRGGIGRYGGGNPNVWLSNNYSNNNVLQFKVTDSDVGIQNTNLFALNYVDCQGNPPVAGPGWCIPQQLFDAVRNGGRNNEINVLDPDFKIPSDWKYTLGATYMLDLPEEWDVVGGEYLINADLLYSISKDSAIITRADFEKVGEAAGGLPIYDSVRLPAYELTNVSHGKGDEILNFSVSVAKSYDFGLDWNVGYAYTDSKDVSPMTSSVAFSNYNNVAVLDPNDPGRAVSNYNVKHRIAISFNYSHDFWKDFATKFSLFGYINSGKPYSYAFQDINRFGYPAFLTAAELLYVPTGPNDPNVTFGAGFDTAAFFNYLEQAGLTKYAGGFAPRNVFESDWYSKFDLKISQEFPGLFEGHKSSAFLVIENIGNLLNDNWGVLSQPSFPFAVRVVDGGRSGNGYLFDAFSPAAFENPTARIGSVSLWSMRVGVKYDF